MTYLCFGSPNIYLVFFTFVSYYKIVTSAENYSVILEKLREKGITFETDNGFEMLPLTTIEVRIYSLARFMVSSDSNFTSAQGLI